MSSCKDSAASRPFSAGTRQYLAFCAAPVAERILGCTPPLLARSACPASPRAPRPSSASAWNRQTRRPEPDTAPRSARCSFQTPERCRVPQPPVRAAVHTATSRGSTAFAAPRIDGDETAPAAAIGGATDGAVWARRLDLDVAASSHVIDLVILQLDLTCRRYTHHWWLECVLPLVAAAPASNVLHLSIDAVAAALAEAQGVADRLGVALLDVVALAAPMLSSLAPEPRVRASIAALLLLVKRLTGEEFATMVFDIASALSPHELPGDSEGARERSSAFYHYAAAMRAKARAVASAWRVRALMGTAMVELGAAVARAQLVEDEDRERVLLNLRYFLVANEYEKRRLIKVKWCEAQSGLLFPAEEECVRASVMEEEEAALWDLWKSRQTAASGSASSIAPAREGVGLRCCESEAVSCEARAAHITPAKREPTAETTQPAVAYGLSTESSPSSGTAHDALPRPDQRCRNGVRHPSLEVGAHHGVGGENDGNAKTSSTQAEERGVQTEKRQCRDVGSSTACLSSPSRQSAGSNHPPLELADASCGHGGTAWLAAVLACSFTEARVPLLELLVALERHPHGPEAASACVPSHVPFSRVAGYCDGATQTVTPGSCLAERCATSAIAATAVVASPVTRLSEDAAAAVLREADRALELGDATSQFIVAALFRTRQYALQAVIQAEAEGREEIEGTWRSWCGSTAQALRWPMLLQLCGAAGNDGMMPVLLSACSEATPSSF